MSLSDMDDDLALATLIGRAPRDADERALSGVLSRVSDLAHGPAPTASAGLAAFLAAQSAPPVLEAAPVVTVTRPRGRSWVRRLVPAGLAAKVVLGAAGVAVAGTTSFGAIVVLSEDDVPPRRPVVLQPSPAVLPPATSAGDGERGSDVVGPARRASSAVEARRDGRGRDDERAAAVGGGTRDPRADRPTPRPERPVVDAGRPAGDPRDARAGRPAARPTERPEAKPTERPEQPEQRTQPLDEQSGPTSYGVERRQAPVSQPGGATERRPAPRAELAPADDQP